MFRRPVSRARTSGPSGSPIPPARPILPAPRRSIRATLVGTLPGRLLVVSAAARLLVLVASALGPVPALVDGIGTAANLGLVVALGYFLARLLLGVKRRLLWRVRRKLILSYILMGFVPVLLIVAFFVFGGLVMFLNISSYLFKTGVDELVDEVQVLATTTVLEIDRGPGLNGAEAILARKVSAAVGRLPGLSMAVISTTDPPSSSTPLARPLVAGPWRHLEPPARLPVWVGQGGFGGLLAYIVPDSGETDVALRAAAVPEAARPAWGVVVDLPIDAVIIQQLREGTGIQLDSVSVVPLRGDPLPLAQGREQPGTPLVERRALQTGSTWLFNWVAFFDYTDWESGRTGSLGLSTRVSFNEMYTRIFEAQPRIGSVSLGDIFLIALGIIAVLFLIIEVVALGMGFALAKSITGSVHALFTGTEKVRRGELSHRIDVRSGDQLGELADSFNEMTRSIGELLREAEEKERLAEELRIARQIQMSLLPRGPLLVPGLAVTALCQPALEVGGDYYDFFRLSEDRLGILIADVSGKGTSAALYMAELKGVVASLSGTCQSPKQLLVEANRIISGHLDPRSFITMMYAVLDLQARTLTYARAGHTPLIYLPACGSGRGAAQVLLPDGMVVGLRLDGFEGKFEELLEEWTLPVSSGDVFLFFTDGVTEAMNADSDLFGESRLSRLVEEHGHLSSEELRERILREIQTFAAGTDQHDDLTLILVKVEDVGARSDATSAATIAV